jgi:hypothetical protein
LIEFITILSVVHPSMAVRTEGDYIIWMVCAAITTAV